MNVLTRSLRKHFSKIPLKIVLIVPFVVLTVLAAGLVGYISFRNGQKAVNDATYQLRSKVSRSIENHLHTLLAMPHQINQINVASIKQGLLSVNNQEMLENRFWRQVQIYESISSIYFGNTQGGLADCGREGAAGSLYVISTDDFKRGPLRKYAIDHQGSHSRLLVTVPDFDARTRQWYTAAVEKGAAVWSPVYILSTGQDMAVAASCPVYDDRQQLLGVVSVDMFLSHLSHFLHNLRIGGTGQAFIMEPSGLLIASSSGEKPYLETNEHMPKRRLKAIDSTIPVIRCAAQSLSEQAGDYQKITVRKDFEFKSDGRRHFLQVSPFHNEYGLDWLIAVVIPEAEFMNKINANNRMTGLLIIVALSVSGLIGILVAQKISKPISMLSASADSLAKGEWTKEIPDNSHITEVSNLTDSFNKMTGHLWQMLESLKHQVNLRKRAEQVLKEGEERFRSIFDNSLDGILFTVPNVSVLAANRAACEMLGWSQREICEIGRNFVADLTDPGYQQALKERTQTGRFRGELNFKRKDGLTFPVELSATLFSLENGHYRSCIIFRDITERKQAEQTLLQLNENLKQRTKQLRVLVSELALAEQRERRHLAEILHDHLQQLLVGAKINGEVLSASIGTEHKQLAEHILNLINQSLQTSRSLTAELSPSVLREGRLSAALQWLARWMQENYRLTVELETNPDIDPGPEDITLLLFQSTRELLLNVVKHAGVKSARIQMARNKDNELRVSVMDGGSGFDPDIIREKAKTGTGFGLFSIRERLELVGGSLKIESSQGNGASLSLVVPLETTKGKDEKNIQKILAKIHSAKTSRDKIRVLLADDHTVVRQGLSTMLNLQPDVEVIGEAADGEEAVEKARKLQPDVILMDISMPKMDGLEATRVIHSESPHLRIIGLSMHDQADRAAQMIGAGASAYCTKDGATDRLLSAIRGEAEENA